MSFKEYGSGPDISEWVTLGGVNKKTLRPNPTKISGHYLGAVVGPNKFDDTKTSTTLILKTDKGRVGVNASSNLVTRMKRAEEEFQEEYGYPAKGAAIIIEFLREEPSKKGNPVKIFKVQLDGESMKAPGVDDENSLPRGRNVAIVDDSDDAGDSFDEDYTATTTAAARKAEVEGLLKRSANSKKK